MWVSPEFCVSLICVPVFMAPLLSDYSRSVRWFCLWECFFQFHGEADDTVLCGVPRARSDLPDRVTRLLQSSPRHLTQV